MKFCAFSPGKTMNRSALIFTLLLSLGSNVIEGQNLFMKQIMPTYPFQFQGSAALSGHRGVGTLTLQQNTSAMPAAIPQQHGHSAFATGLCFCVGLAALTIGAAVSYHLAPTCFAMLRIPFLGLHHKQFPWEAVTSANSGLLARLALLLGADPLKEDTNGDTALHHAALDGADAVTLVLLNHLKHDLPHTRKLKNVLSTIKNRCGDTPLDISSNSYRTLLPLSNLMLLYNALVDAWDDFTIGIQTVGSVTAVLLFPLVYLLHHKIPPLSRNDTKTFLALWDAGGNSRKPLEDVITDSTTAPLIFLLEHLRLNKEMPRKRLTKLLAVPKDGSQSLLRRALAFRGLRFITTLVAYGAPVKTDIDRRDNTLLHQVAARRHDKPKLIKYLIEKGVSVNAKNTAKQTALHLAARHKNNACIKELIEHQADVNCIDNKNNSALHYLCYNLGTTIKAYQQFGEADLDPDMKQQVLSEIKEFVGLVRFMVAKGADITIKNKKGKTPLNLINPAWVLDFKEELGIGTKKSKPFIDGKELIKQHPIFEKQVYQPMLRFIVRAPNLQKQVNISIKPSFGVHRPLLAPFSGCHINELEKLLDPEAFKEFDDKNLVYFFKNLDSTVRKQREKFEKLEAIKDNDESPQANGAIDKAKNLLDVCIFFNKTTKAGGIKNEQ